MFCTALDGTAVGPSQVVSAGQDETVWIALPNFSLGTAISNSTFVLSFITRKQCCIGPSHSHPSLQTESFACVPVQGLSFCNSSAYNQTSPNLLSAMLLLDSAAKQLYDSEIVPITVSTVHFTDGMLIYAYSPGALVTM